MNISTEATDDVVLAFLWLTLHDDYRVWKGLCSTGFTTGVSLATRSIKRNQWS
ncbi:hypothetical protein LNM54_004083 [Salmonella enterica subsp. enterica]|nr:hypothetical protein [Salmonella enterica subsp. enterica]